MSLLSRGYYGFNNFNSFGFSCHLRPFNHDIGFTGIERYVRLDNVESNVGKSDNTSHIRSIQLSCSQYQGEK
jgi:hypothetical protein